MTEVGDQNNSNDFSGHAENVVQAQYIAEMHLCEHEAPPSLPHRPITAWDPFDLQVHRTLEVVDAWGPLPQLPTYVRRAHDRALDAELADVSSNRMIVLVGGSSTGKTRALFEALSRHAVLRHWTLVNPGTAEELCDMLTTGQIERETVLWLNETHNYITGAGGQAAAAKLHRLLRNNDDVVQQVIIVGTLWPEFWARLISEPMSVEDPYVRARQLLNSSIRVTVAERFSAESVAALREGSSADPRLRRAAMTAGDRGTVIQTLVGGPQLVRRFEAPDTAVDRYASAVVSAALDARRLGHRQPFKPELLAAAASAYLTEDDRIDAPDDWFEQGLRRAARDKTNGISALVPCRSGDDSPGEADGFELHDYLEQYGWQARRFRRITESLWDALVRYTTSPADCAALGESAYHRLVYEYAERLLTSAAEQGHREARRLLAKMFAMQGRFHDSVMQLCELVITGDHGAQRQLVDLLADHRAVDDLQVFVDAGDPYATWKLAEVYEDLGELEKVPKVLGRLGDGVTRSKLADVLIGEGKLDDALGILASGDALAHWHMIAVLVRHGRVDALVEYVHPDGECMFADLCVKHARAQLVDLLIELGEVKRLRDLIATADIVDQCQAALAMWKHGHVADAEAVLGPLEAAGDDLAKRYLATMRSPELEVASEQWGRKVSPPSERHRLTNVLAERAGAAELGALADTGYEYARWRLLNLLAERGDFRGLTEAADAGHEYAARRLAMLLGEQGHADELLRRASRGDMAARTELVWLARDRGSASEEAEILRFGVHPDGRRIIRRQLPR